MTKLELLEHVIAKKEHRFIVDYVKNLPDEPNMDEEFSSVKNIESTGRRVTIREWFVNNGALFRSFAVIQPALQKYTWKKILGKGSFSVAHLVAHKSVDFVIKISYNPLEKSMLREIDIMKKICHPNLVRMFEYDFVDETLWFKLEFCDRGNLENLIYDKEPISLTLHRRCLINITEGLRYLHGRDIIHRDIKVENVLVSGASQEEIVFKLADFNLSRLFTETSIMSIVGTPISMAPEILSRAQYDKKSDIWGILCVSIAMYLQTTLNPILLSTDELVETLKPNSEKEEEIIRKTHKLNPSQRVDAEQLAEILKTWNVIPRPRSQSLE